MANTFLYANNAKSALAGAITNTATSANLTSGSGVLFPNPSAGQQFALTFVDAATGLLNEIVYVTARTGDVITMVRAQEGTTALNWNAGDLASSLLTAGNMTAALQPGQTNFVRTRLLANTTFYVSNTGSDSTGNGSAGNPWATMTYGLSYIESNIDFNQQVLTLKWNASVSNTENIILGGAQVGLTDPSQFVFDFNGQSIVPANNNLPALTIRYKSLCLYQNVVITNPGGSGGGVYLIDGGIAAIGPGVVFGNCGTGSHITATLGGRSGNLNNYTISGGAGSHFNAFAGGWINPAQSTTVTVTGTPAFSGAFAIVTDGGIVHSALMTFTGGATGIRYSAGLNGVINTSGGGANYFPGNSAGTTGSGGQYN